MEEAQSHLLAYEKLKEKYLEDEDDISAESFKFLAGADGVWSTGEDNMLQTGIALLEEGSITASEFIRVLRTGNIEEFEAMVANVTEKAEVMNSVIAKSKKIFEDMQVKSAKDGMYLDQMNTLFEAYKKGGVDELSKSFGDLSSSMGEAIISEDAYQYLNVLLNSEGKIPL